MYTVFKTKGSYYAISEEYGKRYFYRGSHFMGELVKINTPHEGHRLDATVSFGGELERIITPPVREIFKNPKLPQLSLDN